MNDILFIVGLMFLVEESTLKNRLKFLGNPVALITQFLV
jgi:hypothetical protein